MNIKSRKKTRIFRDLVIVSSITIFLFLLEFAFKLFERLGEWLLKHQVREISEFLAVLVIFVFIFSVFSIRKWKELRDELAERERADEALRKSEEKYRTLFEESRDAIYITTREGKVIDINPSGLILFGYTREEMVGLDVRELYANPVDRQRFQREIEEKGFVREYELKLKKKDGTEMGCLLTSTVRQADDGTTLGYQGIIRDITERKQTEKMAKAMLDNVVIGISNISPKMEILWLNKTLQEWFPTIDVEKKPFCYRSFYSPPKEGICDYCPTIKAFKTGKIHSSETGVCADGKIYNVIATPVKNEKGEIIYVIETVEDISDRKRAEEVLRASARRWQSTFDAISDAVCLLDLERKILQCNKAMINFLGKPVSKIIGRNCWELVHGTAGPIENCLTVRMLETKQRETAVLPLGDRWFGICVDPIFNEEGNLIGAVHIMSDITDIKRTEDALRESEEEYRTIFETTGNATVIIEEDTTLSLVNKEFEKLSGYSKEEIEGKKSWTEFASKEDLERLKEYHRLRRIEPKAAPKRYEFRFVNRQGNLKDILITIDMIPGTKKSVASLLDISERKRAMVELKQSFEKLGRILEETATTLASAVEKKDPYTAGHQQRVAQLACAIVREMGLSEERINGIRMAALIHDIGKIYIPAEILSKPGRLTEIEYSMIKTHPELSYDISKTIEFPWPVAQIILQHHERINGSGYPSGLTGENILLEARILGVADTVEAISSHRPYRPAYGIEKALKEVSEKRGILYDPAVVDACLRLFFDKGFKFE